MDGSGAHVVQQGDGRPKAFEVVAAMVSVAEAVRRGDPDGLAALVDVLAAEIDAAGVSPNAKAALARVLLDAMAQLRELDPGVADDKLDDLAARRSARRKAVSG